MSPLLSGLIGYLLGIMSCVGIVVMLFRSLLRGINGRSA
jgi:hypothetical protein